MGDLYTRLEEIQEITRVLVGDVGRLRGTLGSRTNLDEPSDAEYGARRRYVRAIFALVEATVEQHKQLLLDLETRHDITLDPTTQAALLERTYSVDDNGSVSPRVQFLQLRRKLRLVYRAASEAFAELAVRYDDQGWQRFSEAIKIRDRITHPRSFCDCHVEEADLGAVDDGHKWFQELSNELVRVAREHRERHGW